MLVLSLCLVAGSPPAAKCHFTTAPVTADLGGGVRSWVWTEPYSPSLFQDGLWQADAAYETYAAWLNATIPRDFGGLDPFDQRACLRHQRAIFAGAGYATHDWDVILNGTVGTINRMNCIESLLWGEQNKAHPQTAAATEFGAYILLDGGHDGASAAAANTTVKVYLQTGPTLGVPGMSWVDGPIRADLDTGGFRLLTFLHLHPFDASNTKYQDCAGTCIPSSPDLSAFAADLRAYACDSAWITNGADSFRFPLSQLGLFDGEEDSGERPEIYRGDEEE